MNSYYVYIMANFKNTTFYIGVSNDLQRRLYEHKNKLIKGFTSKYNLNKLVYFEETNDVKFALWREKQLKNWHREWKINLIKSQNPNFMDLSDNF
ncbi:MAG: GIY-YIG nuclease family protein [Patescibacteria group bacterium]